MNRLDRLAERLARRSAQTTSRRGFLGRLALTAGATALPLLPISRSAAQSPAPAEKGDPQNCDYWRYCAIDGFLCSCCGGSVSTCPPGTEPSPITWVGTCHNPTDGRNYIISYNDCCGKSACGRCGCNRNEGDKPVYMPSDSNDLDWCLGTQVGVIYNCSTAVVLGEA